MPKTARFGVSLEASLLRKLDAIARERGYRSRSQAIGDFVRRALVKKEWNNGTQCMGTVSLAFLPEDKGALSEISKLLRARAELVLSCQLFDAGKGGMFAVVAVKGRPAKLQQLADALRGLKGVKHGHFAITAPC